MIQERHRIPLNDQIVLLYNRTEPGAGLEACYAFPVGYAQGEPGVWHALFRVLQQQLPEGWYSGLESTPDWTFFKLRAMPEARDVFYNLLQLISMAEVNPEDWQNVRPLLLQEARFEQANAENHFENIFFQLAWPQTGYARPEIASAEVFEGLAAEDLQAAAEQLFTSGKVYLRLSDSLPLPRVLQALDALLELPESAVEPLEPWALNSTEAVQELLEYAVPGGWVWQGFRVPGLLSEGWMHGLVLKHWFEQVKLLEGLPEGVDFLECRWQPWMQGSLLYLVYHIPQAAELEQAKFHVMEWLLQAREGYLTPRRLRKAIQACHSDWLQSLQSDFQGSLALRIEEFLHGSARFKTRLQAVSLESLQGFWRQYLQADNLITLEIMHESTRKQRSRSYREHFPSLGYRPSLPSKSAKPLAKLATAQKVDLGQGCFARLVPLPQTSSLCLGAWFDRGSRHERMSGAISLLFSLLAQRFERLLQQQDSSGAYLSGHTLHWHVDRDFSGFYWLAPAHEYRQALLLFRQLLEPFTPERSVFDRAKHQLLATTLHDQFSLAHAAKERFFQSGFGNHPYARSPQGDYYALQALSPEDIQQAWQDLFASSSFQPLLAGALPQELAEGLLPELFCRSLNPELAELPPERSLLLRRGEIQMQTSTPLPLRLEGRIFAEPLPLGEQAPLVLLASWLNQSLERQYPGLGRFQMEWLQKAWLFYLLVPDTPESYLWRTQLSETHLEAFEILRQSAVFEVRRRKQDLHQLWPALARWEALGLGATSFLDLDRELLILRPHQVEDSLQRWFGERNEWLQIRVKA
ncbi:hypothetical protein COW36_17255 [bacterium (Candidatus Blackallbacteria) CG17_big_fil_post_rev_8_21_14_2_50_48_46]|uniref:Peptidase M16 C-terminal domain-containing protein n=1 Tax=bacterium (Candidatus Blackallbacteria) CG17_big_fil_post_rev_8_21_14_2_50_48_46 TaxID=2014261 RepID=A0A2M7G0D0_9BACT|nr:MAG: hypothetical protein COW64_01475 [bacterium (Candidatus Blackallbacteria) CG18_big_fil_WC_8_21_14_2_50_49_26]PIW15171.1 MAG: hypothetical protein COW36_17255 [bacterium (Candidatus Blackallbacteria) CG17_big_fil_post_rev_8_21_14_2_50_48_46]PIW50152.1 MAG: hypothetical protein COW20_03515 [bacterium (Candidatus Blackallbacteria) CG13_big_fil_rev_8_21_14_2_50_49_14]